jgi:hypothetical protein
MQTETPLSGQFVRPLILVLNFRTDLEEDVGTKFKIQPDVEVVCCPPGLEGWDRRWCASSGNSFHESMVCF